MAHRGMHCRWRLRMRATLFGTGNRQSSYPRHQPMTPLEDTLTTAQTPSRHCSLPPWGALCT